MAAATPNNTERERRVNQPIALVLAAITGSGRWRLARVEPVRRRVAAAVADFAWHATRDALEVLKTTLSSLTNLFSDPRPHNSHYTGIVQHHLEPTALCIMREDHQLLSSTRGH